MIRRHSWSGRRTASASPAKSAAWVAERCLLGACGRVGGTLQEGDFACIQSARLDAVLLPMEEDEKAIARLRAINPAILIAVTLSQDLSGEPVAPEDFRPGGSAAPGALGFGRRGPLPGAHEPEPAPAGLASNLAIRFRVCRRGSPPFFGHCAGSCRGRATASQDSPRGTRSPGSGPISTDFLLAAENAAQEADWLGVQLLLDRAGRRPDIAAALVCSRSTAVCFRTRCCW